MAEKELTFEVFSSFSPGRHFDYRSGTVYAILVKSDKKNFFVQLYWNWVTGWGGDSVIFSSIFSSESHLDQRSRTVLVIVVKDD